MFIFTLTKLMYHRESGIQGSDMNGSLEKLQMELHANAVCPLLFRQTYSRALRRSLTKPTSRRSHQPRSSGRTISQQHLCHQVGLSQKQVNHRPKHPDGRGPAAAVAAAAAAAAVAAPPSSEALETLQYRAQALRVLFQV